MATPVTSQGQYLEDQGYLDTDFMSKAQNYYDENIANTYDENIANTMDSGFEAPVYTGEDETPWGGYGGGYVPLEGFLR